nr:MAG TPA: Major head protein [Bacteriophage sp.]
MEVPKEADETEVTEIEEGQKSTKNNEVGEITLEQFKTALESNLEIKGYYDSVVDKTVSKRLDKSIESWKEKNLNNLIEEEINKRYPQKTEAEIKLEEINVALEKANKEKQQLELKMQYQELLIKSNIPVEMVNFLAGNDTEETIKNIETFKGLMVKYVDGEVDNRMKLHSYIPGGNGSINNRGQMSDFERIVKGVR